MGIPSSEDVTADQPFSEDLDFDGAIDPGEDLNGNGSLDGYQILVNGRPFNGTGFGYNSAMVPKLDPTYTLQPNRLGDSTTTFASYISGDADESYDAVDFQNMALAGIVPTATATAPDGVVVIPSFHRSALINYWISQASNRLASAPTTMTRTPGFFLR